MDMWSVSMGGEGGSGRDGRRQKWFSRATDQKVLPLTCISSITCVFSERLIHDVRQKCRNLEGRCFTHGGPF